MPRVRGIQGPYQIFFTSFDCIEPPHIHVERDRMGCKFWIEPLELAYNRGFGAWELNRIQALIGNHRERILEIWNAHCSRR